MPGEKMTRTQAFDVLIGEISQIATVRELVAKMDPLDVVSMFNHETGKHERMNKREAQVAYTHVLRHTLSLFDQIVTTAEQRPVIALKPFDDEGIRPPEGELDSVMKGGEARGP